MGHRALSDAPPVPARAGVVICTYRRPVHILRALDALAGQTWPADDVIVVARADDRETLAAIGGRAADGLPLRVLTVSQPGRVHALNAALAECRTAIVAFTDDDAEPRADWLARIVVHFDADPTVGGVGGRDRCHDGERFDEAREDVVGRLQWFGRAIGHHHRGVGGPRPVDFLKGANMSYRATAIAGLRFDVRLRGRGAQPMDDLAFSCAVRRAGWRLIYDPAVAVDHFPAARDEARAYVGVSAGKDMSGLFDCAFNEVVALWPSLSTGGKIAFLPWSFLVGTSPLPGLMQAIRYTPRLGIGSWRRFVAVQHARLAAWRLLVFTRTGTGGTGQAQMTPAGR